MATPAMVMEAFFSATKTQPQSEEELQSVLADLPRRELQALSKAHGVKATLKRESLVEMLVSALKNKMWPAAEAVEVSAEEEKTSEEAVVEEEKTEEVVEKEEDVMDGGKAEVTTVEEEKEEEKTMPEETATDSKKSATAAKKKSTTGTASTAVGKKAAVQRKTPKSNESPKSKAKKSTTVKVTAKAVSPSVVLEKLHAKEIAKQPTLQQHDQAKKQRAAGLLSAATSKFSVVKKTRSKTKELADAAAASTAADKSITKTLSFGAVTPVKQKPPVSAPAALPSQKETKKGGGYKPYVGKLPAFEGDSLFTPKKAEPRPAPMAVAVMKAARVMTPKKAAPTPTKKAVPTPATKTPTKKPAVPTQVKRKTVVAPTKKAPTVTTTKKMSVSVKKVPTSSSSDKENSAPPTSNDSSTEKPKNALITKSDKPVPKKPTATKPRVSVKATATKPLTQEAKKGERRANFTQDAKTKSTAARRQARSTPSAASTN